MYFKIKKILKLNYGNKSDVISKRNMFLRSTEIEDWTYLPLVREILLPIRILLYLY